MSNDAECNPISPRPAALQAVVPVGDKANWAGFAKILPAVPLVEVDGLEFVSPYGSFPVNSRHHNGETPELYSTHPWR